MAYEYPAYGQARTSNELRKVGVLISSGGVRSIWLRHGLETFKKRLSFLEEKAAKEGIVYTEAQLAALESAKRERESSPDEIETARPGYLISQDTFYVGYLKGVGRSYQQTVVDTYSSVAFAKVYTAKVPVTAADALNDRVLPFFEQHNIPVLRVLTDCGTEYCGSPDKHPYQLYLQLNEIEHTKTKVRSPQTNGICERFHQTILNEFYRIAFRKKIYDDLETLQTDLDAYIDRYNSERTHQGKRCQGTEHRCRLLWTAKAFLPGKIWMIWWYLKPEDNPGETGHCKLKYCSGQPRSPVVCFTNPSILINATIQTE